MLRVLTLALFLCAGAFAQIYDIQGWGTNCTASGLTDANWKDTCTPPNNYPVGSFPIPSAGVVQRDPLGNRYWTMLNTSSQTNGYSARSMFPGKKPIFSMVYSQSAGPWHAYNLRTRSLSCTLPALSGGVDRMVTSAVNPNLVFGVSAASLVSYNVGTCSGSWVTQMAYNGTGGRPTLTNMFNGGTAEGSTDDHIVFFATSQTAVCVAAPTWTNQPSLCYDYSAHTAAMGTSIDFAYVTHGVDSVSGKRYIVLMPTTNAKPNLILSYTDIYTGPIQYVGLMEHPVSGSGNHDGLWVSGEDGQKSGHSAVGHTADGRQFWLKEIDRGDGARWLGLMWFSNEATMSASANIKYLHKMAAADDGRTTLHIGCSRWEPGCLVSYYSNWFNGSTYGSRPLVDTTTAYQALPSGWLTEWVTDLETANPQYKYMSLNRNYFWSTGDSYLGTQRCNISGDAQFLMCDTYHGYENTVTANRRTIVIDIGYDPKNLRVVNKTATTATLLYDKPSLTACTYAVSTNFNLSSPVASGSDSGLRNSAFVPLTGLTTATNYLVGVTCNGMTARYQFRTN